jgi:hypothetical protein
MHPWSTETGGSTSDTRCDLAQFTPYDPPRTPYILGGVSDEPVQRLLLERMEDPRRVGRPLSSRARQSQRSLEAYLRAGVRPRWMERLIEIEGGMKRERRRLAAANAALREECGADRRAFARRWRAIAADWRFDALNELIRTHNEWYPVERDLPMDLRTRDYVLINGRSYRRPELGADWILEQFPPR